MPATAHYYVRVPADTPGPSPADLLLRLTAWCERGDYTPGDAFIEHAGTPPLIPTEEPVPTDAEAVASAEDDEPVTVVRPAFRALVAALRAGPRAVVVVNAVADLGADPKEAARAYGELLSLDTQILLFQGGDATTALVSLWAGREARERLGERVRAAMRRKAVKGEALGRPPYGYRVGPRRRLEPVPEEVEIVRAIFRMYTTEGMGIRLIARKLNDDGHKTRRGGTWSMVTIRDILRNRVYIGTYARFGVLVPGSHPAIIATDDFRRAQERMVSRRTAGGPRTIAPYLLSGLAFCGYCGARMIGVTRRQRWQRRTDGTENSAEYRYYQCGSRTNQSRCDYHTRSVPVLDDAARQAAAAALSRQVQGELAQTGSANVPDNPKRLFARLRQLDRQMAQVLDLAATGRLSGSRLEGFIAELGRGQLEVEDAFAAAAERERTRRAQRRQAQLRAEQVQRLTDGWEALDFETRRALLLDVVERVTVHDDDLSVTLRA